MRYTERRQYLLGPTVYPVWQRITGLVVAIVVPLVSILALSARLLDGATVGQAIVTGLGTAFQLTVQMLFWFTLVFVLIERFGESGESVGLRSDGTMRAWTIDDLPDLPDAGRISLMEVGVSIAVNLLLIGSLLWVQLTPPIAIEGVAYPLFDPALWSFWLPYFIVITAIEIVFYVLLYRHGRWSWAYAVGNAVLGAAFAIPALYLIQNGMLFNPELIAALVTTTGTGDWVEATGTVTALIVVLVVIIDAIDGFMKARRATEQAGASGSLTA